METKDFSPVEVSIVRNMLSSKSHKDIAKTLNCDIEQINTLINSLVEGTEIKTYQMKLDERKPQKDILEAEPQIKVKKIRPQKLKYACDAPTKKFKRVRVKSDAQIKREEDRRIKEYNSHIKRVSQDRRRAMEQPLFKTKKVDYSQLMPVKVDPRTSIYVPAEASDEEIEVAKANYLKQQIKYKKHVNVKNNF